MFNPCLQLYGLVQVFSIRESIDKNNVHNGWYVEVRFMGGSHSFRFSDSQVQGLQPNDWIKISCLCQVFDASFDYQGRRINRQAFLPVQVQQIEKTDPFK